MIGSFSPWFCDELDRRVLGNKTEKALELAQGAAPDYPAYQYACGLLAGLDLALEIAGEIKKELDAA